ncbi:MAG: efflux RND transporter permease subunit [Treponema sp.]|nr:efflux RND transporter permease subunit [Treponema sp.]
MNKSWYRQTTAAFFILATITVMLAYIAFHIEIGEIRDARYTVFSIRFDYYGMDAHQIERLITIPLEEKIMPLSGLVELRSSVEYSKSVTTAYFNKNINRKNCYLSIRNEVDDLYNKLPNDVQKPRITTSASTDKAVMCIAFSSATDNSRAWIEANLKKDFEAIEDVSDVIVAGGTTDEIHVLFDTAKVAALNQNPATLATVITDGNSVNAGAILRTAFCNEKIVFDTRLHKLDDMRALPIKADESYTTLEYVAAVENGTRTNEEIVRINGEACVTMSVLSSSNGNSMRISKECRALLEQSSVPHSSWNILYDNGEVLSKMTARVFSALMQSFICIILIIPFFFNSIRVLMLDILFLIVCSTWTLGFLHIAGYALNQHTIAGISIALGLVSDAAFVINETAFASDAVHYVEKIQKILPAIVAAALTTIIVLVPLYFLEYIVPGIRTVSITVGIMIINSVLLAAMFYPCFLSSTIQESLPVIPKSLYKKISLGYYRASYFACERGKKHTLLVYIIMAVLPVILFFLSEKNISAEKNNNVIYAAVEFESDKCKEAIDEEIAQLIKTLVQKLGVTFVRTEARKGCAEIEIGFDEKKLTESEIASYVLSLSPMLHDGFLYVPGAETKRNKTAHAIELCVVGDEITQCMKYAEAASQMLYRTGMYDSVVLNFKNPETIVMFRPSHELLHMNALTVEQIASMLRWMMFGPVADKWFQNSTETDIRIRGINMENATLMQVENLYVPVVNGGIRLGTLGTFIQKAGQGKIYRKDGRRAAFFTVEISGNGLDVAVKKTKTALNMIEFEKGYGISFPREVEQMAHQYRTLITVLVISILGVFILLVALTENFLHSCIVVSLIPTSLLLPVLLRFICYTPLEMGDITGMVMLSGVTVNNAIYIISSARKRAIFKMREKIASILVTSLTSIAGALPLLFSNSSGFSKQLAFFMVWGVVNSLVVSVVLFPNVLTFQRRSREKTRS